MKRMEAIQMLFVAGVVLIGIFGLCVAGLGQSQIYRLGPSGGQGGEFFADYAIAEDAKVLEVRVAAGEHIDSVQTVLMTSAGRIQELPRHGGYGGRLSVLTLSEGEHITAVRGGYHEYVNNLEIDTNERQKALSVGTMTIGEWTDTPFSYEAPAGMEIVGFVGNSGGLIDSIGVVIRKLGSSQAAAWPQGMSMEPDTDRMGMSYKTVDMPAADPAACASMCKDDPACQCFTYVKPGIQGPGAVCWLKNGVPAKSDDSCCISGVKSV